MATGQNYVMYGKSNLSNVPMNPAHHDDYFSHSLPFQPNPEFIREYVNEGTAISPRYGLVLGAYPNIGAVPVFQCSAGVVQQPHSAGAAQSLPAQGEGGRGVSVKGRWGVSRT